MAVTDRHHSLTFAELNAAVGAAAARIASLPLPQQSREVVCGAGPILPIIVDRSVQSVIAVHAAVRAGRAFTPLESSVPAARIDELFSRLEAPVYAVVANPDTKALLPPWVRAIDVDHLAGSGDIGNAVEVHPKAPGCVVFTSGSTGQPKGVVRSWAAHMEKLDRDSAGPAPTAQVRPFSFSAGLGQLIRVAAGDALHIADVRTMAIDDLLAWLQRLEVTTLGIGASLTAALLRSTNGARCLPHVTTVRLGGEPITWDIVPRVRALVSPEAAVLVQFSATEVGEVTRYTIGPDEPGGTGALPIGIAERATRVRLAPIDGPDSPLEMIIRDPVAMHYLADPELTAERFVIDDDGVRWWRSGDTVRIDERGRLLHRGRVDDMVKINGLRIEPRETEAAMRALPGVSEAVAVVYTTPHGRRLLAGHIVVDDALLTPSDARRLLRSALPGHLVPAVLMRHHRLPVTDRGKVDVAMLKAAMPKPWRTWLSRKSYSEPALWMAGLVTRLVDLGEVGVDDDIWDAGLDSLGAVEMCAAIAAAGLGEIDPTKLMEHPTAHLLERYLAGARVLNPAAEVVLNPSGTQMPVFAIPGGGGTALAFRSLAHFLGDDQPLVVVEPWGMHQPGPVAFTIAARAQQVVHCVDERLPPHECCVVLGYSAGATVALEVCRRLLASGRRTYLVLLDAVPRGADPDVVGADPDVVGVRATGEHSGSVEVGGTWFAADELFAARRQFPADGTYYLAFRKILRAASADYDAQRVAVDATLVQLHDHDLADACNQVVNVVDVVHVGGDHQSMLHPPHVEAMAQAIAATIRAHR